MKKKKPVIPRSDREFHEYMSRLREEEAKLTKEINQIRRELRRLEKELVEKNKKYRRLLEERRKIRKELERTPKRYRAYRYRLRRWALEHPGSVLSRIRDDRLWKTKG